MKKTALQLTMHRVKNYGSVLQAYALNHYINSLPGWECKVIDLLPNVPGVDIKGNSFLGAFFKSLRLWGTFFRGPSVRALRMVFAPYRRWYEGRFLLSTYARIFDRFVDNDILKTRKYETEEELFGAPPDADVYITGSDQTFNPRFTNGSAVWFLDFVKPLADASCMKISYASSIAASDLADDMKRVYKRGFANFTKLSFRESAGVGLALELGFHAHHCCDPTLLLTKKEWEKFAAKSTVEIGEKYILVYNLRYMVDPYPFSAEIERQVQNELGLKVVYLNGPLVTRPCKNSIHIWKATPHDFVKLFFGASFIITDSFHGTAFSLIGANSFLSFVREDAKSDSRVMDLLSTCGAQKHAVAIRSYSNGHLSINEYASSAVEQCGLCRFRDLSCQWIINSICGISHEHK